MGAIFFDNWSIEQALFLLELDSKDNVNEKSEILEGYYYKYRMNPEYSETIWYNFISSLLLWDELWFYEWGTTMLWEHNYKLQIESLRCDAKKKRVLIDVYKKLHGLSSEIFTVSDSMSDIVFHETTISDRTDMYCLLSNILGISCLLHPKRKYSEDYVNYFNRMDIFKRIDKELIAFYENVNKELGRELVNFKVPVLYDYIRKNCDNKYDELAAVLALAKTKEVIALRDNLYDIECNVCQGNIQMIISALNKVTEITKELTNKYKENSFEAKITLNITPAIPPSIKSILNLPLSFTKKDNILHTRFIKQLVTFGLKERQLK